MAEFFYRTEDIRAEDVPYYFVETQEDRKIVDALKSQSPVVLVGSRGVGKSFLFRVAEAELWSELERRKVLPIYVAFSRSSLVYPATPSQFQSWMLAKICSRIVRTSRRRGYLSTAPSSISILAGSSPSTLGKPTRMEEVAEALESSWQKPGATVDTSGIPSVDAFRDAVQDMCEELELQRVSMFIDEAAHIFIPEQQRQFFTLFRDLRSPYITCNAAVYPGVTSYGDTFQPTHDATFLTLERDILAEDYVRNMREIVAKQAQDSTLMRSIDTHRGNFAVLAYAASGNPRVLLKTVSAAPRTSSRDVNAVVREFYRTGIWSEHSDLAEKYPGHRILVDWGRNFVEQEVIPELKNKNDRYLDADKKTSCFFWIHRDAPQSVKEALRLLAYTGVVREHATGIKATRGEIGTRYAVNLGCLFALEPTPAETALEIARNLTPKRMSEYGANHPVYHDLVQHAPIFHETDMSEALQRQLTRPIDVLDITPWQKERLTRELGLQTVGDVLRARETKLQEAYYVGEKRSRRMRNAAIAAVNEYLSG